MKYLLKKQLKQEHQWKEPLQLVGGNCETSLFYLQNQPKLLKFTHNDQT
jgi:hypothetical protein